MPPKHQTGSYIFSVQRQDSTVAAKNFITLHNPSTSDKNVTISAFFTSFMATVAAPAYPIRGYRTLAGSVPSGGTLATAADICKFDTSMTDSSCVIRTANPTVSLDGAIFNSPPGTVKDTIGPVHMIEAPPGFNPFTLRPGEGVVLRQDVGAVGMFWNLSIIWRELKGT